MQKERVLGSALAIAIAMAIAGCGGEGATDAASSAASAGQRAPAAASSGEAQCLLAQVDNPCALLDEALVRRALPSLDGVELTVNDLRDMGGGCSVSWNSGRTTSIGQGAFQMSVETDDSVALTDIKPYKADNPVAAFRHAHRTPDAAARSQAEEAAAQSLKKQQDEGKISAEQGAQAADMAARMINSIEWQEVADLGDAAAWGGVGRFRSLSVLVGASTMSLTADVSNEDHANRDAAVAVARAVIEACD